MVARAGSTSMATQGGFISSYAVYMIQDLIQPASGWDVHDSKDLKNLDISTLLKTSSLAKSSIAYNMAQKTIEKEISVMRAIEKSRRERIESLLEKEKSAAKKAATKAEQEQKQAEMAAQARDEVVKEQPKDHSPVGKLLEEKRKLETRYEQTDEKVKELVAKREEKVEVAHKELNQVFKDESTELLAMAEESLKKNPNQPELREATEEFAAAIKRDDKANEMLDQMIQSLKAVNDPNAPAESTLRNRANLMQDLKITQVLKPLVKYGVMTEQDASVFAAKHKAKVQKSHQEVNAVNKELNGVFGERKEVKQELKANNEALQTARGEKSYTPPATKEPLVAPIIRDIKPRQTDIIPPTPGPGIR